MRSLLKESVVWPEEPELCSPERCENWSHGEPGVTSQMIILIVVSVEVLLLANTNDTCSEGKEAVYLIKT